jgi:serine protease Do
MRVIIFVSLFAALLVGCGGGKYRKAIAPVTAPAAPINLADRAPHMTVLSSMTFDIKVGTPLGELGVGGRRTSCSDYEPITYTTGRAKSNTKVYESVFRDVMSSIGVPVEGVQRFEGEDIQKADLQIAATVKDMSINICYPRVYEDRGFAIGDASLTIEWAVFSPIERKVIYTAETKGSTHEIESRIGETGVTLEAFRDALLILASKEEFANALARKQAKAGATSGAITLTQPPAQQGAVRHNLEAIRRAVVTVRSNIGEGSGFAIGDGTFVVTSAHVVSGTSRVKMVGNRDEELYGEVVRSNAPRDVALIKLTQGQLKPLHVLRDGIRAGDDVFAIGSPLGAKYAFSVTGGVISGFPRIDNRAYIQSDVNVLPGSSGGPLVDAHGNVVGITVGGVAFAGAPAGMNFFVPATELFEALSVTVKK